MVVEDEAFVGSRSMVVDGARVREGAKLGAGCILTASTRVYDAESGDKDAATEAYREATRALDKAAGKGIIHRNTAANKKSRLAKRLNS